MNLTFASIVDPAVWSGAGGALIGLVAGQVTQRGARLAKLEAEVEECRRREADFRIVTAGVRMMVGELRRELPKSTALKTFGDMLEQRLGPPPTIDDFRDLLTQVDRADEKVKRDEPTA